MAPIWYPKPFVLAILLAGCTALALYVGVVLRISIVYTHLFYVPIVLGGLWYPRQSLFLALYLAILHLGVEYVGTGGVEISVFARAGSFLLVAGVVGLISGRIQRSDQASLRFISSYAERVSAPRARITSTFDGIRMSLGMNMDIERMRERGDILGLIRTLDHSSAEVRYQAADALGTLHDSAAGERLAQALRDPDCGVRWKAAEALGRLGASAVPHLFSALQDPATDVRWRAALALGDTRQEEAIPLLIEALSDPDPYVQGRSAIALAQFGAPALPFLATASKGDIVRIQEGAIRALGRMGDPGLSMLHEVLTGRMYTDVTLAALEKAFFDQGTRSIPLMTDLITTMEDPRVRALACRVLGSLGDLQGLKPLLHVRYSEMDEHVRDAAANAIRRIESARERTSK